MLPEWPSVCWNSTFLLLWFQLNSKAQSSHGACQEHLRDVGEEEALGQLGGSLFSEGKQAADHTAPAWGQHNRPPTRLSSKAAEGSSRPGRPRASPPPWQASSRQTGSPSHLSLQSLPGTSEKGLLGLATQRAATQKGRKGCR
jgi:hypothetical protein